MGAPSSWVPKFGFFNIGFMGGFPTGLGTNLATAGCVAPDCLVCRLSMCSAWVSWISSMACWWGWWCSSSFRSCPGSRSCSSRVVGIAGLCGWLGGCTGCLRVGMGLEMGVFRVPKVGFINIVKLGVYPTGCGTNLATAGCVAPDCLISRLYWCSAWVSWLTSGSWWCSWCCSTSLTSCPGSRSCSPWHTAGWEISSSWHSVGLEVSWAWFIWPGLLVGMSWHTIGWGVAWCTAGRGVSPWHTAGWEVWAWLRRGEAHWLVGG